MPAWTHLDRIIAFGPWGPTAGCRVRNCVHITVWCLMPFQSLCKCPRLLLNSHCFTLNTMYVVTSSTHILTWPLLLNSTATSFGSCTHAASSVGLGSLPGCNGNAKPSHLLTRRVMLGRTVCAHSRSCQIPQPLGSGHSTQVDANNRLQIVGAVTFDAVEPCFLANLESAGQAASHPTVGVARAGVALIAI
jgi:hypothetical protein